MIQIKNYKVLKGLLAVEFHHKMIALAMWISHRYSQCIVTGGYRVGDSGVHGQIPCRGIDYRSFIYVDAQAIADDINKHWIYDPERPRMRCALIHDAGKGVHLHTQVHDRTIYLEGGVKDET